MHTMSMTSFTFLFQQCEKGDLLPGGGLVNPNYLRKSCNSYDNETCTLSLMSKENLEIASINVSHVAGCYATK